jgi:hypothetical protein
MRLHGQSKILRTRSYSNSPVLVGGAPTGAAVGRDGRVYVALVYDGKIATFKRNAPDDVQTIGLEGG